MLANLLDDLGVPRSDDRDRTVARRLREYAKDYGADRARMRRAIDAIDVMGAATAEDFEVRAVLAEARENGEWLRGVSDEKPLPTLARSDDDGSVAEARRARPPQG